MPHWLEAGFSSAGLLVVVLQQIPGIIRALWPPKVDPFARNSGTPLVEILEKTFGIGTVFLVVVVLARVPLSPMIEALSSAGAFLVLAAYYVFYIQYYRGIVAWPILLGMAAFPPVAFALIGLSGGNWPAIITSVAFGMIHVGLTRKNLASAARKESWTIRRSGHA